MIGFAGLSHLGIVSSIAAASKGLDVFAYDPDASLCKALEEGRLPIKEPGLAELLKSNQSRLRFSADPGELRGCEVIYFSPDVKTDVDGRGDLSPLRQLIDDGLAQAAQGATVVVLSQVPPGFTRRIVEDLKSDQEGRDLQVCYQVETLIFGKAVDRALYPERLIVGCAEPSKHLPQPYAKLLARFDCPVLPMTFESAELAKISINMMLVASISAANTLAELCEAIGAEWSEIVPALQMDSRIGPHAYLSPGLGISGGNLERDMAVVTRLAAEYGTDARVVEAWISNSDRRREWVLQTILSEVVPRLKEPAIGVWGLAYKPNTDSTKHSPALDLIRALGPFPVRVYDPVAVLAMDNSPGIVQVETAVRACRGADVLAVMTPWEEFSSIDLVQVRKLMAGNVIIDPFGALDGDRCVNLGFSYFRMGSPARLLEVEV